MCELHLVIGLHIKDGATYRQLFSEFSFYFKKFKVVQRNAQIYSVVTNNEEINYCRAFVTDSTHKVTVSRVKRVENHKVRDTFGEIMKRQIMGTGEMRNG